MAWRAPGERIRQARLGAGMTQSQLARVARVSERNIVRWEKDEHTPRPESLAAIAQATGRPLSYFIEVDEDDEEPDGMAELRAAHRATELAMAKLVKGAA